MFGNPSLKRNTWVKFALAVLIGLSISLLFFAVSSAQEGQPEFPTDNDVNTVAKQLYCPVCPNTPLDVCETKACQDWRAQIKDQLSQGWSEEQIVAYFIEQYGERVLAEPKRGGFTSMVWMLPVIGVVFGLAVVGLVLKTWRREHAYPPSSTSATETTIAPEILARLEK